MGGTRYPGGQPPSHDTHRSSPRYFNVVHPQKNNIKAKYQQPPDFKQPSFGTVNNSKPMINAYPHHPPYDHVWLESFPHYNGSPSMVDLCASPPKPNTASSVEHVQGPSQTFMDSNPTAHFMTQYPPPAIATNAGLPVHHHMFPALHHSPFHSSMYNSAPMLPYIVLHSAGSDMSYSNTNTYFDSPQSVYTSEAIHGVQADRTTEMYGHPGYAQMTTSHVPQHNVQDGQYLSSYSTTNIAPVDHPRTDSNTGQPPRKVNAVEEDAYNFVASFCPLLGEKPYCLPPVKRSKHPDKSIKQLAVGMESEKRVLGSFERFFAEQQIPVLMLCHYPMAGFMQVYKHEMSSPERDFINLSGEHGRGTLTLLLLSDVFSVTIVTVSIISGNSDFAYIQKGVHKAAAHVKRCSRVVSRWLSFLGVMPDVRQVIAFPNLKKAVLQRIAKDKQVQESLGSVSTLHVDDLSAPFEEEWSAPEHKQRFRQWMQEKVVCHTSTLSRENLQLVVGALLSPRLSQVDFVNDQSQIFPISESSRSPDVTESLEDVSQLKLTIDGVTKPFDWFMNEYVTSYYPKLDEVTYRVPPIHFNIQSLRKPTECIQITQVKPFLTSEESKDKTFTNPDSTGESRHKTIINPDSAGESRHQTLTNPDSAGESRHTTLTNADSAYPVGGILGKDHINGRSDLGDTHNDIRNGLMPHDQPRQEISDALGNFRLHLNLEQTEGLKYKNKQNHDLSSCLSPVSTSVETSVAETSIRIQDSCLDSSGGGVQNQVTSASMSPADSVSGSRKVTSLETALEERLAARECLESLQDVDVLSEVMTKDVRADEGENRVIGALEKLGHHFGPMFIICDYQYNNYLNKLREEMFSKGETRRPIRAFGQTMRAEHDCLILHKKYGVLVVCIKAIGDNFRDWGASEHQKITSTNKILEKAVKQLEREEAMIRHVTSDLDPRLACHKLIALPNMTRESVERALAADRTLAQKIHEVLGHGAGMFLCSDELPAKFQSVWDDECGSVWSKLVRWWKQVEQLLKKAASEMTTRIYRQIVGRYCGLLSTVEVWSPTNPRVEVRNTSEAVGECAGRFCKLVLLPRQLEALCSNDRRMFLYGPPGCGKTLLLMLKARQWLQAGQTVILINSRPGSLEGYPYAYGVYKRLQEMMEQLEVRNYHLMMIRIDSLHFQAQDLAGVMPSCCIIMDEVSPSSHEIIEHLSCLQVKYIWCAGLFEEDKPITEHPFTSHKNTAALTFTSHKMDKIIRCPPVIQSIMKHTERDVKLQMPYRDIYQNSCLGRESPVLLLDRQSPAPQRNDADFSDDDKHSDKENSVLLLTKPGVNKGNVLAETTSNQVMCVQSGKESSRGSKWCADVSDDKHDNEGTDCPWEHMKGNQTELKYDPDSLEKRLQAKYDPNSLEKRLQAKYDPDSLDQRLQVKYYTDSLEKRLQAKYGKREESHDKPKMSEQPVSFDPQSYCSSSAEAGLPTDGPWPYIIDHRSHSQPGGPRECFECGQKVAEILEGLVRPDSMRSRGQQAGFSKNKLALRSSHSGGGRVRTTKPADSKLSSLILPAHMKSGLPGGHKLNAGSDNRATLSWSDVLIVAKDMPKDCAFVAAIRSRQIPVEVLMRGKTSQIEDLHLRKLFITQYKEVTGLERPVIVFVPSCAPDQRHPTRSTSSALDIHLGQSIGRFTSEDRTALWHVASRSLASLLMVLP